MPAMIVKDILPNEPILEVSIATRQFSTLQVAHIYPRNTVV